MEEAMPDRFTYKRVTPEEFERRTTALGVPLKAFARITGTNYKTVRSWVKGQRDVPPWVSLYLFLMESVPSGLVLSRQWAAENIEADKQMPGVEKPWKEEYLP